jgi:hypothetical protein
MKKISATNVKELLRKFKESSSLFVLKQEVFLPAAFKGETAVLKMITELTMTTTRFTQLPTEWVTGDTLCNIM